MFLNNEIAVKNADKNMSVISIEDISFLALTSSF